MIEHLAPPKKTYSPEKRCISFQTWLFWASMLVFGGVYYKKEESNIPTTLQESFGWPRKYPKEVQTRKSTVATPPKFNCSPLKNGGWKTTFLLGPGNFSGANC